MLSSIASFLPSALHINQAPELPRPTINPDTEDEEEEEERERERKRQEDANGSRGVGGESKSKTGGNDAANTGQGQQQPTKGKEKEKLANEIEYIGVIVVLISTTTTNESDNDDVRTFIFVRPPPSKSNHPLNLQVQLVPPNGRPPTGVTDTSTTPTSARSTGSSNDGASLARTSSNRSDASSFANSYNTSTASFNSVASSASTSTSTRRTIIPLYNLQAHNVMTNVIVDAGTDAKIAKFQKRGIELIDLAMLEPVEVWGEKDKEKDAKRESMRISVDEMGAMMTNNPRGGLLSSAKVAGGFFQSVGGNNSRPVTPSASSSAASLHSNLRHESTSISSGAPSSMMTMPVPQTVVPPQQPQKRNLFNKLFNKRNSSLPPPAEPEYEAPPSFASFSLHPAPVLNKIIGRDADKPKGRPPPLQEPLLSPSTSPISQQTTPTQPQTPRQEDPVSPAVTIAPPKERGHGRNLSLTSAITTPFKTTLRNNRNRLSAVITGGNSSGASASSLNGNTTSNTLTVPGSPVDDNRSQTKKKDQQRQREASPNPSMTRSSRSQLSLHAESVSTTNGNGNGNQYYPQAQQPYNPIILTQSQAREELVNLKQQQLQLRPPILGIQPTFVSASSSSGVIPPSMMGMSSPLVAALSPRVSESQDNLLQGQRALMYVWLVRKWLKRRPSIVSNPFGESGMFGGLKGGRGSHGHGQGHSQEVSSGAGGGNVPAPLLYGGVEVRFEWKRAKGKDSKGGSGKGGKKSRRGKGTGRGRSSTKESSYPADDGGDSDPERVTRNQTKEGDNRSESKKRKASYRMSTGSLSTAATSEEGKIADDDGGEDSDPEDSETPWVCTLKIRRNVNGVPPNANDLLSPSLGGPVHGRGSSSASTHGQSQQQPLPSLQQPQIMRVKIGTLSPTPHHPKVVAMLKIPFPLPDVEVERMGIVRRKGFPVPNGGQVDGEQHQGREVDEEEEPYTGLTLTAEEIKDVVCSTGLWLVVREGFGGVGRVSRKGDGWRIRA